MRVKLDQLTNIVLLISCVMLSALVAKRLLTEETDTQQPRGPVENVELSHLSVSLSDNATLGMSTAKLVVIEFSDFQCPFCGQYARDTYPELRKDFIDTGKIRYVFADFPLSMHPLAPAAAQAADCARSQGHFWEMHDRLFENQRALAGADLINHAAAIGLDAAAFKSCLDIANTTKIARNAADAQHLGITSTPTFVVGLKQANNTILVLRKIVGAQPYRVFRDVLSTISGDSAPS